jgi:hypothetical protein
VLQYDSERLNRRVFCAKNVWEKCAQIVREFISGKCWYSSGGDTFPPWIFETYRPSVGNTIDYTNYLYVCTWECEGERRMEYLSRGGRVGPLHKGCWCTNDVMVECKRGEGKRFYSVEIHSQRPRNPGNPGICCNLTEFNKEFEAGVNDSGICGQLGIIDSKMLSMV